MAIIGACCAMYLRSEIFCKKIFLTSPLRPVQSAGTPPLSRAAHGSASLTIATGREREEMQNADSGLLFRCGVDIAYPR